MGTLIADSMKEIEDFNNKLSENDKAICCLLREVIEKSLKNSNAKLYHGSPVWFIHENPIVGYSKKKEGVALLFWSGQSFTKPGLKAIGKFKAAEIIYNKLERVDLEQIKDWLLESMKIQWDYKDIIKNKGEMELL